MSEWRQTIPAGVDILTKLLESLDELGNPWQVPFPRGSFGRVLARAAFRMAESTGDCSWLSPS